MRIDRFLIALISCAAFIVILSIPLGTIPPLGKFLQPVHGFLANGETENDFVNLDFKDIRFESTANPATSAVSGRVYFDERLVPHIFADDDASLYFLQGFIHAKYRLWQMETQTRAAGGRLSEVLGPDLLEYDRLQRRIGMVKGAENALEEIKKDEVTYNCILSYTAGVNEFIHSNGLNKKSNYASLPLEYKLLNYMPEDWTPLKTMLLLKYMSNTLTGYDSDVEYTNLVKMMGRKDFDLLFPDRPEGIDPIIPSEKIYDYQPEKIDTAKEYYNMDYYRRTGDHKTDNDGVGSNNWAVGPAKTKNGNAILCNDPHLVLNLPSLWYEMQLSSPTQNVYGVSLPGAPCIIIGFNDSISWGTTNGGRDVRDWYEITWRYDDATLRNGAQLPKDAKLNHEYRYDDKWLNIEQHVEVIKIKGEDDFIDTVYWTIHGPMVYRNFNNEYADWNNLAMRWAAIDPSNELKTFYEFNIAKNYDDYRNALQYFSCPTQNFVFASVSGDIAITQQGKHAVKWPEQGRFVMDGKDPASGWQTYIPWEQNPFIKNPARGFVSSANQHPSDSTYPYYYTGFDFEFFRNRRINNRLVDMEQITVEDMKHLQQDNFNFTASEALPIMLLHADPAYKIDSGGAGNHRMTKEEMDSISVLRNMIVEELEKWDYMNTIDAISPTYFQIWWDTLYNLLWDEFYDPDIALIPPDNYYTILAMKNLPADYHYFDIKSASDKIETLHDVVNLSLIAAAKTIFALRSDQPEQLKWYMFKHTAIMHIAQIPALSREYVRVGGYRNIVNATSERNGPSWRMVVEMSDPVNAYGVYPGGQSGNPGSKYYDNFIDDWAAGNYYKLNFYKDEQAAKNTNLFMITFN